MKQNLSCAVIRDLLPLYAENLVCGETKKLVEEHFRECAGCREQYEVLIQGMEGEKQERAEEEKAEIDSMKRIRRYQRNNLLLGAVVSFLLGVFLPMILIGISVVRNGGFAEYQLARLQAAWHILFLKMFLWGVIVCAGYLTANWLFLRGRTCKRK